MAQGRMAVCLLGLLAATGPGGNAGTTNVAQPKAPRCEPVSDRSVIAPDATIDSGTYTLTIAAVEGPSEGARAVGNLFLSSTQKLEDSTAAQGAPIRLGDARRVPLFGTTTTDFGGVSAPIEVSPARAAPQPRSFDPVRPGVLVLHHVNADGSFSWQLLVGTTANDRQRCAATSDCYRAPSAGPGAVLDIARISEGGFSGGWHGVGNSPAHGFFCAVPRRYYGPFQSRSLPGPPPPHGRRS